MPKINVWAEIKGIFRLAVKGDNLMDQDTLFQLQEKVAILLVNMANGSPAKVAELKKEWPCYFE